jgi:hypothetical protein
MEARRSRRETLRPENQPPADATKDNQEKEAQVPTQDDVLNRLKNAKVKEAYAPKLQNNPVTAEYELEVTACKVNPNGFYGPSGILGFKVLKSHGEGAFQPGADVDYTENFSDEKKGGLGRFTAALAGVLGVPAEKAQEDLDEVFGEDDPLIFMRVKCSTFPKPQLDGAGNVAISTRTGKPIIYTGMRWSKAPLTAELVKEINAKRTAAGLKPIG